MHHFEIIDRGRGPELAGTRITVYDVVYYLEAGRTAPYIAATLGLSVPKIEALVRYIDEHRHAVMAVHREIEARIARGNPPEIEAKLAKSPTHALVQKRLKEIQRKRLCL